MCRGVKTGLKAPEHLVSNSGSITDASFDSLETSQMILLTQSDEFWANVDEEIEETLKRVKNLYPKGEEGSHLGPHLQLGSQPRQPHPYCDEKRKDYVVHALYKSGPGFRSVRTSSCGSNGTTSLSARELHCDRSSFRGDERSTSLGGGCE